MVNVGPAVKICWTSGGALLITRRLIDLGKDRAARSQLATHTDMPFAVDRVDLRRSKRVRLTTGRMVLATNASGTLAVMAVPLLGGTKTRLVVYDSGLRNRLGPVLDTDLSWSRNLLELLGGVAVGP